MGCGAGRCHNDPLFPFAAACALTFLDWSYPVNNYNYLNGTITCSYYSEVPFSPNLLLLVLCPGGCCTTMTFKLTCLC